MRIGRANGEGWLRLGEAAAELGVSLNTLRRWSDSGKLTCYRSPGGHRRYRRGDVEALLRAEDATGVVAPSTPARAKTTSSGAGELRAPLHVLARVAAEGVGVTECRISLAEADGAFTVLTARSRTGDGAPSEDESLPGAPLPTVREVLLTGRRLVIADLGSTNLLERPEAEALRQRGDAAILAVPLAVDGRNNAVLELVESRAPRAFTGANVTFAEFMARQAARLLSGERDDGRAGAAGQALPDDAVAGEPRPASRPQDLLLVLAGRLRHELRAVACDILRYDRGAGTLEPVAASASGEAPPLRGGLSHPVADFGPAADTLASGDPVLIRDLAAIQAAGPHLIRRDQSGARSVYASPIHLGQEVVGLIEIYSRDAAWSPDREELALTEAAAGTAALALAGDHDPAVITRRVAQLDDLIAGFSMHSPTMDAESLVLSTLRALRTRKGFDACTVYRVDGGVATPFPAGDAGGNPVGDGVAWQLSDYPPAAKAAAGRAPVVVSAGGWRATDAGRRRPLPDATWSSRRRPDAGRVLGQPRRRARIRLDHTTGTRDRDARRPGGRRPARRRPGQRRRHRSPPAKEQGPRARGGGGPRGHRPPQHRRSPARCGRASVRRSPTPPSRTSTRSRVTRCAAS